MSLSGTTFIRDAFNGYTVFESMASWLPLVDEFVVLDLGSVDGTLEYLQEIAAKNPKVRLVQDKFTRQDASAFADAANECIDLCQSEHVLFYQADEVPHENVLRIAARMFSEGCYDMSFWRYQLKENFQILKWFPHIVHRVGTPGPDFEFVVDGMNTNRIWDAKPCHEQYDAGFFTLWGENYDETGVKVGESPRCPVRMPTHEMILDVGKCGAFRDTIRARAAQHFPFWSDSQVNVDQVPIDAWWEREKDNPNWDKEDTPFDIPKIMRYHLGKPTYTLRDDLFVALCEDLTKEWMKS